MDEELPGFEPGNTALEDSGLAERLIRDEFAGGVPTHAHRARGHGDGGEGAAASHATTAAPPTFDTAEVPVVATEGLVTAAVPVGAAHIHEEFARPARKARSRSHRVGMLAGLGVVGALLAVLVVLAPGGGTPRLPSQSVHDVSPISASGPKTAAATTPTTAAASTTTPTTATPTTTPPPNHSQTVSTYITYSYTPSTTAPAATPTTAAPTPTTVPPAPATTTTTSPPPPTTTTTAPQCILGLIC